MDRLERIRTQRKLQGLKWNDLAKGLPISGEGLRIAFTRNSVAEEYLDVVEQVLGIKETTEPTKEEIKKTLPEEVRFEDIVAKKVIQELGPLLNGNTEKLLKAIMNLHIELNQIKNAQAKTQETVESIEQTLG